MRMVYLIAVTTGAVITYTSDFRLLQVFVCASVAPAMVVSLVKFDNGGILFGLAALGFCTFLLIQGYSLYREYWAGVRARAAEKAVNRELQAAKSAAEAANLAKSQFLANMSHEIRTPIHGILGLADLALQARTLPEAQDFIHSLQSSGDALLRIVNDILDFSKVEAGKLTLEQIPFSIRELVEGVRKLMYPQAHAKDLKLNCFVDEDVIDSLEGDPARLRQILINLLGNAVKFTAEGSIRLEVTQTSFDGAVNQAGLLFRVHDTGIGIAPEKQQVIFEAFGQADGSVTRHFGGTGLGLTICSRLVQLMGGRIWVESEPGHGSTFSFTCVMREAQVQQKPAIAETKLVKVSPMRVLLAEDNAINQRVAKALLSKHGHEVTITANGIEALEAWEAADFDLVLLDNQMPEMGGLEAVRILRQREQRTLRKRTPVIALTASAMSGDRERFLASGMDGYIAKPFRAEELYEVLLQVTNDAALTKPLTSAAGAPSA
ncbi:MAG: response regulator [Acidobacteriaceae bacterium]|nr:response regulator [Acidobacteriaceae bacterium]